MYSRAFLSLLIILSILRHPEASAAIIARASSTTNLSTTPNFDFSVFPQIWVADGVVSCGQQLVPEPCDVQQATNLPIPYPAATVVHTHFPTPTPTPTPTTPPQRARTVRRSAAIPELVRRNSSSVGNNSCGVELPSSFSSNSINNVCRFVGNNQDRFVSLAPLPPAYMPSWPDYLISAIFLGIALVQILSVARRFGNFEQPTFEGSFKGRVKGDLFSAKAVIANTIIFVIAVTRTVVGVGEVITYRNDFGLLPFISPLLWLDWIAVASIIWPIEKYGKARYVPQVIAAAAFGMNTWLTIGYISFFYGTQQYTALDIPAICAATTDSLAIDPRRQYFADFHVVLYIFSLVIFIVTAVVAARSKKGKIETAAWRLAVMLVLSGSVVVPALVGVILAAVLNKGDIVLLTFGDCYGSVVSGRLGYFAVDYFDWTQKLAAWLGVNV